MEGCCQGIKLLKDLYQASKEFVVFGYHDSPANDYSTYLLETYKEQQ